MTEPAPFAYEGLDRVIHERARLGILTSLASNPKGLVFGDLRRLCGLTDGNHQPPSGGAAGDRPGSGDQGLRRNRPQTLCRITSEGRTRFLNTSKCWTRWCAKPPRRPRNNRTKAPCPPGPCLTSNRQTPPAPLFWKDTFRCKVLGDQLRSLPRDCMWRSSWTATAAGASARASPAPTVSRRRRRRAPHGGSRAGPGRNHPDSVRLRLRQLAAPRRRDRRADGAVPVVPGGGCAAADRRRRAADDDRPPRSPSRDLALAVREVEAATASGDRLNLRIALDYSSREAIVAAAARLGPGGSLDDLDQLIAGDPDIGPVDLLVRTGGEQRLSDFMQWNAPSPNSGSPAACGPTSTARTWPKRSPTSGGGTEPSGRWWNTRPALQRASS